MALHKQRNVHVAISELKIVIPESTTAASTNMLHSQLLEQEC